MEQRRDLPNIAKYLSGPMSKPDSHLMNQQSKKKEERLPPDAGQKPLLLQRRRVWRACESCRRKKIKCDGSEPTCSQCATSGSQCTWLQTKDRAALSRHYVQELEARLLHMESLFTQFAPVLEQSGLQLPTSSSTAPTPTANEAHSTALTRSALAKDRKSSSSPSDSLNSVKIEDDVTAPFSQLTLDEHGHMRWIGGSSTLSLIQSFRTLTTPPLQRVSPMEDDPNAPGPSANKLYFPASVFFGKVHALPGPEEVEYPDRDLADKLVDAYFSRFHFLLPVIDKPSFLEQYKNLLNHTDDITLARTETAFMSLVFAVFACAAHLVDDPRLSNDGNFDDGGMGMVYYERALILHYISHASTQVAHVQCFILMSSFLCSVNCLPQAWILVGQAVRIGQDLGLHRSPRRLLVSLVEKETRRKIWWGLYSLDRMLALALGRPLGVEDSDCDVEYPVEYDDDELPLYFSGAQINKQHPSLMAGFISLTALYKIAGQVLRGVYAIDVCKENLEPEKSQELQRNVEVLDQELIKWCDDLPIVFKSAPVTEKQVSMGAVLCSHYYSVLTTLHRNFLPVKREQPVAPKSTVKALSSARACIRLAPSIKDVVPPSHHLAFFIQHLFSSAVILLLYAMHAPEMRAADAAMEEASSSLTALESWEGHWPGARKCKELLIELMNIAREAVREASETPAPIPPPAATTTAERRRSATLANSANRAAKNAGKPRRNASRDASLSRRHLAYPYHVGSQRARSTSRRRRDDTETADVVPGPSFYQSFSNPNSPRTMNTSPHSSPLSVNLPSPPMPVLDPPRSGSPRNMQSGQGPSYAYPSLPLSPVHSGPQFSDYDYGLPQSPLDPNSSQQPWATTVHNGDRSGMEMFSDPQMYGVGQSSSAGYNNYGYDNFQDLYTTLSTTPPSTSFGGVGLPFRGLDYIRNYNSGAFVGNGGEQDSVWHGFDPGVFGYDPELPFSLGDIPAESPDAR